MDIRQLLQDCMLVIFFIHFHHIQSVRPLMEDEDYEDGPSFGRCPWIRNKLKNGRVRYRYKGRVAKFLCDSGYELAGKRSSTCVKGQWSNPLPVCVARGCNRVHSIPNGRVTEMYRGALLVYDCNPGYTLVGDTAIHCDGRRWSSSPPECSVASESPNLSCDFENPDMCGWSHDPNHDFDWKRNQFSTPSGHAGTGPSFDHTFGENRGGYYLYIEASSPRKINDTARLFSPVYFDSMSGGCFLFWYHMYGATTGGLRVYLKPESHVFDELTPAWEKYGDQGNQWLQGNLAIPHLSENFQIVIEGVRGESYVGDTGIDDVLLTVNDCESMENNTETIDRTISNSCRGRCREADTEIYCGCNDNCYTEHSCCHDYATLCYQGNDTAVTNTDEPVPGDYYGKTSSPVTVLATFTESDNTEKSPPTVTSAQTYKSTKATTIATPSTILTTLSSTALSTSGTIATSLTAKSSTATTPARTTKSPTTVSSTTLPYTSTIPSTTVKTTTITTSLATIPKTSPSSTSSPIRTNISTIAVETSSSTTSKPTTTSSTTPVTSTTSATTQSSTTSTFTSTTSTTTMSTSTIRSTSPSPQSSPPISSTLSITTTTYPDTTTESTSLSPNVPYTSTLSTRKTYNLRPRTKSTTPFSSSSTKSVTLVSSNTPMKQHASTNSEATITDRTIWHNAITSQLSSLTNTKSSVTSTTMLTTKTTRSTSTVRQYTTASTSTTTQGPPRRLTFQFTKSTTTPPSSTLETNHMGTSEVKSLSNGSTSIVVSLVVIVLICIAGGVMYYMRKKKNKTQSKLSDDSEMRFLQENDYMEYSDASALDKILVK